MSPEQRVAYSLARDGINLPVARPRAATGPSKAELARLKEEKRMKRAQAVRERKERAAIRAIREAPALVLQQWGHTMREIAIIRGVNLDDIKRSLYWEKMK